MTKNKVLILCGASVYSHIVSMETSNHEEHDFEVPNLFLDTNYLNTTMNTLLNRLSEFTTVVVILDESMLRCTEIVEYLKWLVPSEKGLYISYGQTPTNLPYFIPKDKVIQFVPVEDNLDKVQDFFRHVNGPIDFRRYNGQAGFA